MTNSNDYHFVTEWKIQGAIETVYDILAEPLHYPDWWFPGYLTARELNFPGAGKIGRVVSFELKGVIPYRLSWQVESVEETRPYRLAARSGGDFVGEGIWTLSQENSVVKVIFDWKIRVEKPFLKFFSPLLRPFFIWNHHKVMAAGEAGLKLKLNR